MTAPEHYASVPFCEQKHSRSRSQNDCCSTLNIVAKFTRPIIPAPCSATSNDTCLDNCSRHLHTKTASRSSCRGTCKSWFPFGGRRTIFPRDSFTLILKSLDFGGNTALCDSLHRNQTQGSTRRKWNPILEMTKKRKKCAAFAVGQLKKSEFAAKPRHCLGHLTLPPFYIVSRPLRKPCRCSGSIGLIHQDCLQSWLNQRETISCELCKTPFRLAARYAEATPDRLTTPEVLFWVSHRAVKAWLPFGLRVVFAAFLWLGVTPLATTMLYHCWFSRHDGIFSRIFHWKLI